MGLGGLPEGLAAAVGVVLSATAAGFGLQRLAGLPLPRHPIERVLVAFAVGSILAALAILAVGSVRLPPTPVWTAALVLGSGWSCWKAAGALRTSPALRARVLEPRRCLHAVLSARPELRVEGEDIVLEVQEPHVDELEGPPMSGLVRLFSGIWLRAMRRTQSTAASLELSVGGRPVQAQVTSVSREGNEVRFTLELSD